MSNPTKSRFSTENRNLALEYAKLGWVVFPSHGINNGSCTCKKGKYCKNPGAHPWPNNALENAEKLYNKIRIWWTAQDRGNSNIGIKTGQDGGLWVLEFQGQEGARVKQEWENEHGQLPPTATASLGDGTLYLFFKHPDGLVIESVRQRQGRPVVVHGDGGWVHAPPSEISPGNVLSWSGDPLKGVAVAKAPQWLLDKVGGKRRPSAPVTGEKPVEQTPSCAAGRDHGQVSDQGESTKWADL